MFASPSYQLHSCYRGPRFFRSLVKSEPEGEADLKASSASSGLVERREYLKTLAPVSGPSEGGSGDGKFQKPVNFSLESLLLFKDDNAIHTTLAKSVASTDFLRKRPNYDSRKRKFMAAHPPERRQ